MNSLIDQKLLAGTSSAEIQRELGVTFNQVRYRINTLIKAGLLESKNTPYSQPVKDRVAELDRLGKTGQEIAAELQIPLQAAWRLCREMRGGPLTPDERGLRARTVSKDQENAIQTLRGEGKSVNDIAIETNVSPYVVKKKVAGNPAPVKLKYDRADLESALSGSKLTLVSIDVNSKVTLKCDCGSSPFVCRLHSVIYGAVKSCGCSKSFAESEIGALIRSLGFEVSARTRAVIPPQEIDLYVESRRIAIEYNGLYWHSEKCGKTRNYHFDKFKKCEEAGVRLISIFEDEWVERRPIVSAYLKAILGVHDNRIGARACNPPTKISNQKAIDFLQKHHIQGAAPGAAYGLEFNGVLVAVAVFKHTGQNNWDLVRFCLGETPVTGALGRLLAAFKADINPNTIRTFSDNRYSLGGLYLANGFVKDGELPPDYHYVKGQRRYSKLGFRKDRLAKDYPEVYSDDKTERQMMEELGYGRIWDCGKIRWKWVK